MNNTGMPVDYTWTATNGNKFTNVVEVKEGESVDLNALGDQIKGTYSWTNEWYLTADGKNVIADSSEHIPDGHQKTIYAKYVTVVNFNSLESKGLGKTFTWTDAYNGKAHNDTSSLEVLKGDTLDASLIRNKVVNGANYTNFANVIKGTYNFTNNWYSDAAGTKVVTLNGSSKFTTASLNYYAYLYTTITLQAINNAGLPTAFSFTDKYQANKKYTNQFTVKKGEKVSTAIERGNGELTLNRLCNSIEQNYTWKNEIYTDSAGKNILSNHENYTPTVASQTLYGKWVSIITYNLNGAGTAIANKEVLKGQQITATNLPNATGGNYTFRGWFADNATFKTQIQTTYVPTGNQTIYCKWVSVITYNINGSGNAIGNKEVLKGNQMTSANLPNATGGNYTFRGWFADNNTFKTQIQTSYVPTGNQTIYCKWVSVITYNNGKNPYVDATRVVEEVLKGQKHAFVYHGDSSHLDQGHYTHVGYYLNSNFTGQRYNYYEDDWANSVMQDGSKLGACQTSFTPTGNTTFYARWVSRIVYQVPNSTEDSYILAGLVDIGKEFTFTQQRGGEYSNYTFKGWYETDSFGGKSYQVGNKFIPEGNMKFWEKWVSVVTYMNPYAIADDGSDIPYKIIRYETYGAVEVVKGQSTVLPTMSDIGHTGGWFLYKNDAFYTQGIQGKDFREHAGTWVGNLGQSYIPTGNITLYGQWDGTTT